MTDRRIVVIEKDPNAPGYNRLHAIDPANASSIPLPAFRIGTLRPVAGTTRGEAFIDITTGIASVWDGSKWDDIARPVITVEPNDATILALTPVDDVVYLSEDSGNLFVRTNGEWRSIGIRLHSTVTDLLSSVAAKGSLAWAEDTGAMFVRAVTQSKAITTRPAPIAPPATDLADFSTKLTGLLSSTNPGDYLEVDAALTVPLGTDPRITKAIDGANGDWVLWDGSQAWVVDGSAFPAQPNTQVSADGVAWATMANQGVYVGTTAPTTAASGDLWLHSVDDTLQVNNGTKWVEIRGGGISWKHTPPEAQIAYFDRNLAALGVTGVNANQPVLNEPKVMGEWRVFIAGTNRVDSELALVFDNGGGFAANSDDAPLYTIPSTSLKGLGPWQVRGQAQWAIEIRGDCQPYGRWLVDFTGVNQAGDRIFDRQVLNSGVGNTTLPVIGVRASGGNIYCHSRWEVIKD